MITRTIMPIINQPELFDGGPRTEAFGLGDVNPTFFLSPAKPGVDDRDYQVPFRFTGTINKVTFKPGPSQFTPAEEKRAAEMKARAAD